MRKSYYFLALAFFQAFTACNTTDQQTALQKPNIIYILADDLGYGDLTVYNPASKIKTPNLDQLATEGMRFTDAHSPSSVCTPTRYGILTGRYCWRSRLPQGVLQGYGQALLEKDRKTVASLLKENGYYTGVIGKWHLGLDWVVKEAFKDSVKNHPKYTNELGMVRQMDDSWVDFSKKPTDGPLDHGFDYSYILPASLDMQPYCYLENDVLTELPDQHTPGNELNSASYATGAFWRPGKITKSFDFYDVLPNFIRQAQEFIEDRSQEENPFFLYLPLAAPHSPWVPTGEYEGSSGAGQYGDFVKMVDEQVGHLLATLKESGVSDNTLVIFTSDNGPFWKPDFIERFDHRAAGHYRGMKADIHEGGHRVPFFAKWPGVIKPGSQSDFPTTLTNLMATTAELIGTKLPENSGEDSQSILPVLLGNQSKLRPAMPIVHHSSKAFFAIRKGAWKLIEKRGSGGFSIPAIIEPGAGEPVGQLYNLDEDPSETNNLYDEKPMVVAELMRELEAIRNR
ncbi:MAG: arylsulfatase [Cyclobacteriaceae bacterium]